MHTLPFQFFFYVATLMNFRMSLDRMKKCGGFVGEASIAGVILNVL